MPGKKLITIGRIIKEWGLKGEIIAEPLTFNIERFEYLIGKVVFLERSAAAQEISPAKITKVGYHKGMLRIAIEGCVSPEDAKRLRNALIKIDSDDSPSQPEGVYYHYQIIGLPVYTSDGDFLGNVREIIETGSNDVYVAVKHGEETLVPAIEEVIKDIDIVSGKIIVNIIDAANC
jgi:16S rRNA processing protein RimM